MNSKHFFQTVFFSIGLLSIGIALIFSKATSCDANEVGPNPSCPTVSDEAFGSAKADGYEEEVLASNYLYLFADGTTGGIGPFSLLDTGTDLYYQQKRLYDEFIDNGISLDIKISDVKYVSNGNEASTLSVVAAIKQSKDGVTTESEKVFLFYFDKSDGFPQIYKIEDKT